MNDVNELTLQASNILTMAQQAVLIYTIQSECRWFCQVRKCKTDTSNQVSVVVFDGEGVCVQLTLLG